jgi:hypothetical protein
MPGERQLQLCGLGAAAAAGCAGCASVSVLDAATTNTALQISHALLVHAAWLSAHRCH